MTNATLPWWQRKWAIIVLSLCAAVPLLAPSFPPLIDIQAHLSGYHIQESLADSPELARYFEFEWKFIPNLGVELLIVPLSPLLGVQTAVRLVTAAIPVLAVGGMMWIAREAHNRIPATALFALPLAFAYPLIFGFVNYCLAVSLALVAFGWWLRLSRQGRGALRSIAFAVIAPCVLVTHILGYGVLGLLAGGAAIGSGVAANSTLSRSIWRAFVTCLPLAWPLLLLLFWSGGTSPPSGGWLDWRIVAIGLATILREEFQWWDLASAIVVYFVAALPVLSRGRFHYAWELAVPAGLIWLCAILLPSNVFGSDFVNVRMLPVGCALTVLAVRPRTPLPAWVGGLAILFFGLRVTVMTFNMIRADAAIERELSALDHVERGSRVAAFVVLRCERHWQPPRLQHIGSLATVRRDSFSNDQFARPEGHLLRIRYDDGRVIRPLPQTEVMSKPCERWASAPTLAQALERTSWEHVDYLWLIDVPPEQVPRDERLHPLWRNQRSALFRVTVSGR